MTRLPATERARLLDLAVRRVMEEGWHLAEPLHCRRASASLYSCLGVPSTDIEAIRIRFAASVRSWFKFHREFGTGCAQARP